MRTRTCLLFFILLAVIMIPSHVPSLALQHMKDNDELHSLIIEVEGDPKKHKDYLEQYHPYIEVVAVYTKLFQGLALQGEPKRLERLENLEFVKNVHQVQTYQTPSFHHVKRIEDNSNIVFPSELNKTDYTGKGVKVAVIDTGVDYRHPDLEKNYQAGRDLVDLDNDPMETKPEEGLPTIHGSHVAGIIAANGQLKGVAPDAELYAYRALGPGGTGTSIQVIAAMEQAIKDEVDVINLSLGNRVNGPDYPTSVAVNKAVEMGVAVVIANGNDGPGDWTVGAPATANKAFSVGAVSNEQKVPYLYERWADKKIEMVNMAGSIPWELDTFYPVVNATETMDLKGSIALYQRDEIPFIEKAKQAQENGAKAVIIANNEDKLFQGDISSVNEQLDIPVASISEDDGQWLINKLKNEEQLLLETIYEHQEEAVAKFSSRGPVTVNWNIKPDLVAPGTRIISTVPGGYQVLQGTSMAAPHVAGVIALIKEARPNWSNQQIYGALKTTALRMELDGKPIKSTDQGMGMVRPQEAIQTDTIINDPKLTFGLVDSYSSTKEKEITIENMSDHTQTYYFDIPSIQKGVSWQLPRSFTLAPHEKKKLTIGVKLNAQQLDKGVHQGWMTLHQKDKTYYLPYLFINESADNPKAMGLEFVLKPLSDRIFNYRFYMAEPAKKVEVDLYNPDTLVFERNLFLNKDVKRGVNEGEIERSEAGSPGVYLAIITAHLENGEIVSYESMIHIPPV